MKETRDKSWLKQKRRDSQIVLLLSSNASSFSKGEITRRKCRRHRNKLGESWMLRLHFVCSFRLLTKTKRSQQISSSLRSQLSTSQLHLLSLVQICWCDFREPTTDFLRTSNFRTFVILMMLSPSVWPVKTKEKNLVALFNCKALEANEADLCAL